MQYYKDRVGRMPSRPEYLKEPSTTSTSPTTSVVRFCESEKDMANQNLILKRRTSGSGPNGPSFGNMPTMTLIKATYGKLLWQDKWRTKRQQILQRDGQQCRHCGSADRLQVHHRQYYRCKSTGHKLAPWGYPDNALITLCDRCHADGHRLPWAG